MTEKVKYPYRPQICWYITVHGKKTRKQLVESNISSSIGKVPPPPPKGPFINYVSLHTGVGGQRNLTLAKIEPVITAKNQKKSYIGGRGQKSRM